MAVWRGRGGGGCEGLEAGVCIGVLGGRGEGGGKETDACTSCWRFEVERLLEKVVLHKE